MGRRRGAAMADDEKKENVMDAKEEMVGRVCSISTMFLSCTHGRRRRSARDPAFVDWYLVLQVEEDACAEEIRKQYLQLALQLHPDKNKHPKADVAFKLVSEAYACLSDKAKRKAFNSERCQSFCSECSRNARHEASKRCSSNNIETKNNRRHLRSTQNARSHRVAEALREAKKRLDEEARIIENCMRRHQTPSGGESPLFDPSDYLAFPGYPHSRRVQAPRGVWFPRPASTVRNGCKNAWCESPVYEIRPGSQEARVKRF